MEHIKEGTVKTDLSICEEEQSEYDKKEEELCSRVGSDGLNLPNRLVWIEIERLRTQYQWRPIRDLEATVCITIYLNIVTLKLSFFALSIYLILIAVR